MKRLLLLSALLALALPPAAGAHPLGNFTVNRYSELVLSGNRVYVRYALDLAEVPTFQEGERVRRPGFGAELARRLALELDGRRTPLSLVHSRITARRGAGGLETLRFDAVYAAALHGAELTFRDESFPGRIGWREIVVRASEGAELRSSSTPASSRSDALRAYPEELLESPPDVRSARATFEPGGEAGAPPSLGEPGANARTSGGSFEALVARGDLGVGVILLSLAAAMFWGAAHALTPGHGKAIVAGYLVGARGTARNALALGGIVTVTHTIGVFALGLVTLVLSRFVVPDRLYPWLTLASGLLVVVVGAAVFLGRARHARSHRHGDHHHHHHHHGRGGLVGVGVAAGLLPCPSALVVLLSAIALHRVAFGLALILAFSLGLAATISTIGLAAVLARRAFARLRLDGPVVRALPVASALLILVVGVAITLNSLPEVL